MKQILLITFFISSLCFSMKAQSIESNEMLMAEIVEIKDGKYNIDVLKIIHSGENTTQVKLHAESATNVISRDNFLYFSVLFFTTLVDNMTPEDGYTREIDELIGNADVIVNVFMTKNGLQVETRGPEGIKRTTKKWDDF